MNYEVIDSPRRIAAQDARDQHAAQAELAMHDDFVQACKAGNVNARCDWAPRTLQFDGTKYAHTKVQNVGEVMQCSLDFADGPTFDDVMSLLCAVAYGPGDSVAYGNTDNRKRAQALISRMASTFARFNAEEA